ncbi:MAG: MBL fold metallo-hydrolase [Hyphomonas sp.]
MQKHAAIMAAICLVAACGSRTGRADVTPEDFHFIPGTFNPQIGPDGNTEIFTAPDGLVVVDTGRHPAHSQKILDYAGRKGLPVKIIINTHWHLDHSTGNQDIKAAFPDARLYTTRAVEGALDGFLARGLAATEERLTDPDLPEDARTRLTRGYNTIKDRVMLLPDVPVEAAMSVPVLGRDIELNVTDHAVTESDVWIWDPATKTVIAGDLVTLPVPLFDTGCADGWLAAFDVIDTKPYERVVPGHGFILSADEFHIYRDAFRNLVSCAVDRTGAVCAEGWMTDAAPLLDKVPDADYADKDYARAAATYYVDEIIRPNDKRREFCKP